jgi:hypothetical protein
MTSSGNSNSGNGEAASDTSDTAQIEMTKLLKFFADMKTKKYTSVAGVKASADHTIIAEQLPPPRRFLRSNRRFSHAPKGPAPSRLSQCALGANGQSISSEASNYDLILEYLMDPTATP